MNLPEVFQNKSLLCCRFFFHPFRLLGCVHFLKYIHNRIESSLTDVMTLTSSLLTFLNVAFTPVFCCCCLKLSLNDNFLVFIGPLSFLEFVRDLDKAVCWSVLNFPLSFDVTYWYRFSKLVVSVCIRALHRAFVLKATNQTGSLTVTSSHELDNNAN